MQKFHDSIKEYGFEEENIVKKANFDLANLEETMTAFKKNIHANGKKFVKTLTVVYYGGHGVMKDN